MQPIVSNIRRTQRPLSLISHECLFTYLKYAKQTTAQSVSRDDTQTCFRSEHFRLLYTLQYIQYIFPFSTSQRIKMIIIHVLCSVGLRRTRYTALSTGMTHQFTRFLSLVTVTFDLSPWHSNFSERGNQTRLPCEFGPNPISCSRDIWVTSKKKKQNYNVGQCQTWWSPCRT